MTPHTPILRLPEQSSKMAPANLNRFIKPNLSRSKKAATRRHKAYKELVEARIKKMTNKHKSNAKHIYNRIINKQRKKMKRRLFQKETVNNRRKVYDETGSWLKGIPAPAPKSKSPDSGTQPEDYGW